MTYYNNPAMAAAFGNIAKAFAPPSARDVYAYAKAQEVRDAVQRAREAYGVLGNTMSPEQRALIGIGGAGAIGQFVNLGLARSAAAAAQPGGNIANMDPWTYAAGKNFNNTSQGAALERQNQLVRERIQQAGAMDRTKTTLAQKAAQDRIANAISANTVKPGESVNIATIPQDVRGSIFAPNAPDVLRGNIAVNKDQTVFPTSPDGTFTSTPLQGVRSPITTDQLRARVVQGMPQKTQQNFALAGAGVQKAVGPDGTTVIQPNAEAIGMQPAPTGQEKVFTAVQNGKALGPAVMRGGKAVNPQTGAVYPANVVVTDRVQGDVAGLTTATQSKMQGAEVVIRDTLNTVAQYEKLVRENPSSVGLAALIKGTAQDLLATGDAFSKAFGGVAQDVLARVNNDVRHGASLKGYFDTSIPAARFLQHVLAYKLAQAENPQGEVSRQAFERALGAIGSGMLTTPQSVAATMATFRQTLQSKLDAMEATKQRQPMPSATGGAPAAPGVTRYRYDSQGNLIK